MLDDIIKENEEKQRNKQELQDAGAKTAHAAGKMAASYLGGTVGNIAYDKLANTKLGQTIEQGAGKVISKVPGVNRLNKKLNDSGAVDLANKMTDLSTGRGLKKMPASKVSNIKRPGLKKTGNTSSAPQALQRRKDLPKFRQNITNSNSVEENTDDMQEDEYSTPLDTINNTRETISAMKKLLPIVLPIVIGLLFIILFIVIIGGVSSTVASFFSLEHHTSSNPSYVYNENQADLLKAEKDYNQAILDTIDRYQKSYGITIDKYLLHATVSYRFLTTGSGDIYTDDGNEDISMEELEDRFDSLNNGNSNSTSSTIDYSQASKKIDMVASLMVEGNFFTGYKADFSKNGLFYNTLLNSSFLTSYYKDYFNGDSSLERRTKLVDEIFAYADIGREVTTETGIYGPILSDTIVVYLQTCDYNGGYKYRTNENGKTVFDNPLVNEGTKYPLYLSMTDYLKGVIMAELGSGYFTGSERDRYREGLKAFTVTATTFLLGSFGVDFRAGVSEIYFPSGDCRQVSCDPTYGCSYNKIGENYSTTYSGVDRYITHKGTAMERPGWKAPLTADQSAYLDGILSEVFGEIMVKKGVTPETLNNNREDISGASYYNNKANPSCGVNCLGQDDAMQDSYNGMNYRDILYKYYAGNNYDIINIREDLYITDVEFENVEHKNEVIFYDQNDYKTPFCGINGTTISGYGCGITASAIVTSTLLQDSKYDPLYMNDLAKANNTGAFCNRGGTNVSFFKYFADKFGFKYASYNKDQGANVVEALKTGNSLVIAHMGPGDFTNNGHYIVLSGINEQGFVEVHDPNDRNNKKNRGTGNGWYDIQDIAKQLKGNFYVITKG